MVPAELNAEGGRRDVGGGAEHERRQLGDGVGDYQRAELLGDFPCAPTLVQRDGERMVQVAVDLDAAEEGAHGRVQRGQEAGLTGQRVGPAVAEMDAQPVARKHGHGLLGRGNFAGVQRHLGQPVHGISVELGH